jgi:hypothetical protein
MALFSSGTLKADYGELAEYVEYIVEEQVKPAFSAINGKLRSTIEKTNVRLLENGRLDHVYARNTINGPEIVISIPFIHFMYLHSEAYVTSAYLAPLFNNTNHLGKKMVEYHQYLFKHLQTQIQRYYKGQSIDPYPDRFHEFLGISEKVFQELVAKNGGEDKFNFIAMRYMGQAIAGIMAHEYAHVYHKHIYRNKNELSDYQQRKQEWEADMTTIQLLALTDGAPIGMIPVFSALATVENPEIPGDHPTNICRTLYFLDAVIYFVKADLNNGSVKSNMANKARSELNRLEVAYRQIRSKNKVSDVCDDYVVLP